MLIYFNPTLVYSYISFALHITFHAVVVINLLCTSAVIRKYQLSAVRFFK